MKPNASLESCTQRPPIVQPPHSFRPLELFREGSFIWKLQTKCQYTVCRHFVITDGHQKMLKQKQTFVLSQAILFYFYMRDPFDLLKGQVCRNQVQTL